MSNNEYEYENNNNGGVPNNVPAYLGNLQNYLANNTRRNNLQALLNRENIHANYKVGEDTMLELAIENNQPGIAELLLSRGATIEPMTIGQCSISILRLFNRPVGQAVINSPGKQSSLFFQLCIKGEPADIDQFLAIPGRAMPPVNIHGSLLKSASRSPEMVQKMAQLGVNLNTNVDGVPFIHYLAVNNLTESLQRVFAVRNVDKSVTTQIVVGGQLTEVTLEDRAEAGEFTEATRAVILGNPELWKGWTKGDLMYYEGAISLPNDAERMQSIGRLTICPICLSGVERAGGCMYMGINEGQHHNCKTVGAPYHKGLYPKYRRDHGGVHFCAICSRPCIGHRHYKPMLASDPATDDNLYTAHNYGVLDGNAFDYTCLTLNHGGGGIYEKVIRIQKLVQKAQELQAEVGRMTKKRALEQLVEAFFNAPLTVTNEFGLVQDHATYHENADVRRQIGEGILAARTFGVDPAAFPDSIGVDEEAVEEIPELAKPTIDEGLLPIFADVATENSLNFSNLAAGDGVALIHRDYRPATGLNEVRNHGEAGQYVSKLSLADFIRQLITTQFSLNLNEVFGYCPFHPECKARLWPQDLMHIGIVGEGLLTQEEFDNYKAKFNRKFKDTPAAPQVVEGGGGAGGAGAGLAGGRRRIKVRRTRKRKGRKNRKSRKSRRR